MSEILKTMCIGAVLCFSIYWNCSFENQFGTSVASSKRHKLKVTYSSHDLCSTETNVTTKAAKLVRLCREIIQDGKIPYIALVNSGYINLTLNWLCNTRDMFVHDQVIIVATDDVTYDTLRHLWPTIKIYRHQTKKNLKKNYDYDSKGYRLILLERIQLFLELLYACISFHIFETDAIWLRNPVPLTNHFSGADIIGSKVYEELNYNNTNEISVNFMFVNATHTAKKTWEKMVQEVEDDVKHKYEQKALDKLCKAKYMKVNCVYYPYREIADGLVYQNSSAKDIAKEPYVININWIIGVGRKKDVAIKHGHWFLHQSGTSCLGTKLVQVRKAS